MRIGINEIIEVKDSKTSINILNVIQKGAATYL